MHIIQTMHRHPIPRHENTAVHDIGYTVIWPHNLTDLELIITQTGTDSHTLTETPTTTVT